MRRRDLLKAAAATALIPLPAITRQQSSLAQQPVSEFLPKPNLPHPCINRRPVLHFNIAWQMRDATPLFERGKLDPIYIPEPITYNVEIAFLNKKNKKRTVSFDDLETVKFYDYPDIQPPNHFVYFNTEVVKLFAGDQLFLVAQI